MSARASVDTIQNAIDQFTKGLSKLDKQQYDKVYALLKDLSLDSDGKIKPTIENLKVIQRVKNQLSSFIDSPLYQNKVAELNYALDEINKVQTDYFKTTFKDFTKPKTVDKVKDLAFDSAVDQLTGSGINENVVNESADIVEQGIRDGASFSTMVENLKVKMLGNDKIDSKLVSYSKQVINDTLSNFSRNYNAIVTSDLELEWGMYVGALVASSRPICIALVEKVWIHKSELAGISRGIIDGVQYSTAGLMPGTNGQNFQFRCGGFGCNHLLPPVPSSIVPTEIRRKFEPELEKDKKELAKERPKRKTN